jgi:hypothetical protein
MVTSRTLTPLPSSGLGFAVILEGARYSTDRAFRQYNATEPENRLVARTLEKRWEKAPLFPMRMQPLSFHVQVGDGLQAEIQSGRLQRSQNLLSDQCVQNSACLS